MKKILSLPLAVALVVGGFAMSQPMTAFAADTTISVPGDWPGGGVISVAGGETLTILAAAGSPANPTVIQVSGSATIIGSGDAITNLYITSAAAATLTIENLNISAPSGNSMTTAKPAIDFASGSTLIVDGANTLNRDAKVAGIHVPDPNTLTITGAGSLLITANTPSGTFAGGAGIGGNGGGSSPGTGAGTTGESAGSITIEGSVSIEANGGNVGTMPDHGGIGAGIGGGGGSGTSDGGSAAPGDGGGGGTLIINGGTIKASIGGGAGGVGGGSSGVSAPGAGVTATVTGGSIDGTIDGTVKNGSGQTVSMVTVTVGDPPVAANTAVSDILVDGTAYGSTGVMANASGNLYLWLLPSAANIMAMANGAPYSGNISGGTATLTTTFCGGTGAPTDPYLICTPEQLDAVRQNLSANYKLANDIDLANYLSAGGNGYTQWGGEGWYPIGDNSNNDVTTPFTGTFNGDGHIIKKLKINRPSTDYIGLFGYIDGSAVIDSVGVENTDITGRQFVGGIVGMMINNSTVKNCYHSGTVNGVGTDGGSGGVVGVTNGSNTVVINCYNSGAVNGTTLVGGVVGINGNATGTVASCYNSGTVTGNQYLGGVVGGNNNGAVTNCFYDNTINSALPGIGLEAGTGTAEGKTTAEMKTQSTFTDAGWDFTTIWHIQEGVSYPLFQWQPLPPLTDFGLIFDVPTQKFYLNIDGSGNPLGAGTPANTTNIEYTDQSTNWSFSNDTLHLTNFTWLTPAERALTIINGNLNIDIEGANSFVSTHNGASTTHSAGIWADNSSLTVSGGGALNATAGNASSSFTSCGIYCSLFTLNGGSVTASGGAADWSMGIVTTSNVSITGGALITNGAASNNASEGINCHGMSITGGTVTASGDTGIGSYGILNVAELTITGGAVTAQGNSQAIYLGGSVTLPAAYTYWTNSTDTSDPGGAGITCPGGAAYTYSSGDKFVKLTTKNSTLTLTASPAGSFTLPGDVVLTATLAGAAPLDGQTITFTVNGSNAGTGTTDGSGSATYTVTNPAAGTYSFGASFAGYANNVPATAQDITGYVVSSIAPDMSLTASAGATFNDDVTLTVTVSGVGTGITPYGTVTFMQGGDTLGDAELDNSGIATFTCASPFKAGSYAYTAIYSGDDHYNAGSASATLDVPIGIFLSTNSLNFIAAGETKSVTVMSNTTWSLAPDANWATLTFANDNSYTMLVTAGPNPAAAQRSMLITFMAGADVKTLRITQDALDANAIRTADTPQVIVYLQDGKVVVKSDSPMKSVAVYDVSGKLLREVKGGSNLITISGLPRQQALIVEVTSYELRVMSYKL